jgi:Phage integrase, N-terminal SAM-like domain
MAVPNFPSSNSHRAPQPVDRQQVLRVLYGPDPKCKHAAAYYRAIQQFLAWAERAGYQDLEDIEPITVAAYIETLQRRAAAPTVKQHMAAIRMLFSWLTEKGVLAMNPAREVKTERFCHQNEDVAPAVAPVSRRHALHAQSLWFLADVIGLFSNNVGSFSRNVVLRGALFSAKRIRARKRCFGLSRCFRPLPNRRCDVSGRVNAYWVLSQLALCRAPQLSSNQSIGIQNGSEWIINWILDRFPLW